MNTPRFSIRSRTVSDPLARHLAAIYLPKNPDKGEDAEPVVTTAFGELWLGVFDGLGGAGAAIYETAHGPRTGAYLAARIGAQAFGTWTLAEAPFVHNGRRAASLHAAMRRALGAELQALPAKSSRIRSKLIKALPTTAAIVSAREGGDGRLYCNALWAGDSRIYVLSPGTGLAQISRDHLKEPLDAQQNLLGDSPMSNCLAADHDFFVEEIAFTQPPPALILVATDGCFGYVSSPVLFELMLVESILHAAGPAELHAQLAARIGAVTADDASMAVAQFGWPSYRDLQEAFHPRAAQLRQLANELYSADAEVESAQREVVAAQARREKTRDSVWNGYRPRYEATLDSTRYPA